MTNNVPMLLVFAGPNGSGKSTITAEFPPVGAYVNADEIQRYLGCSPLEAAENAEDTREALLSQHQSFTFETVLSTPRNIDLMRRAHDAGYTVICIYVLTYRYDINIRRVRNRVLHGGHDVPTEKVVSRYRRAMKLLPQLFDICDQLLIYDNSHERTEGTPQRIVTFKNGIIETRTTGFWTEENLDRLLSGTYTGEPDSDEA